MKRSQLNSNEKPFSWNDLLNKVNACKSYEALAKAVQEESPLPPIEMARIHMKNHLGKICKAAAKFLPKDASLGLEPISILGDGNCYLRSVLKLGFD